MVTNSLDIGWKRRKPTSDLADMPHDRFVSRVEEFGMELILAVFMRPRELTVSTLLPIRTPFQESTY